MKPLEDTSSTDWDLVMSTNVTAPFCLIREFLPELKAARGSIVNVSSIHANLTKPGFVAYATSKVGPSHLTYRLLTGVRLSAAAAGQHLQSHWPCALDDARCVR